MIGKLRFRFILLAMTTLLILLSLIVAVMNIINYHTVVEEADMILASFSFGRTEPDMPAERPLPPDAPVEEEQDGLLFLHRDTPREARFFTVVLMPTGATSVNIEKISAVGEAEAIVYAEKALEEGQDRGFTDDYRYAVLTTETGTQVTFLDCSQPLDAFRNFLFTSLHIFFIGLLVVFVVIFVLSGRMIRPIAESYEKQKVFITDAGHEIKTPLTIISANVDILEMELGEENESLTDIKGQVQRLRTLTEELVLLARMEESAEKRQRIDFPLSEVIADASHPFAAAAVAEGKRLVTRIAPLITLHGDERAIRQLVNVLLDNAVKYASAESEIVLELSQRGKTVCLTVSNKTEEVLSQEQLSHVFDRFYRTDASRNSETGGYGIGLSVAQAIVNAHGGRIGASCTENGSFCISVTFPL